MTLAARLAGFALSATPDSESAGAEAVMRLSLYDWMACGIAGAQEPVAAILRDAAPGSGTEPVFGDVRRYPPASAAWINGAASHALDYDDTHFAHIGHPSVAIFPAAMACGRNGAETLWAALVGAEVSVRIGQWLGRDHYQTGFHQTATAGAFGATAAAGRLLGLNQAEMEAAFGLAATQAAGLKSQFGTMGKPYHAGLAARTGVEAATLAKAGFDTRGAGLYGPQGFGPTHAGHGDESAFDDLGATWRMETVSHKFHACCHGLHAMLEALSEIDVAAEKVAEVVVTTHPRWMSVCNIPAPKTGLEAKFSYRHTAAMALMGISTAALETFTDAMAKDDTLAALRDRVRVETDDGLTETAACVAVRLADGSEVQAEHDIANLGSVDQRAEKLRRKGRALLGEAVEARLWQATNAERAPNMDALSDLMTG